MGRKEIPFVFGGTNTSFRARNKVNQHFREANSSSEIRGEKFLSLKSPATYIFTLRIRTDQPV